MDNIEITDIQYVYDNIAEDFNRTRYKIWTSVEKFINSLEPHSLIGDIGCGNGKNMLPNRKDLKFKGMDLSNEFVKICCSKGLDVINGNILNIPFEDNYFDHTMSVAVIHHLQNKIDRIKAITELLRITKQNGTIFVYIWAYEQPNEAKNKFNTCDEMVPYTTLSGKIFQRYYHLYRQNEIECEIEEIKDYNYNIIKNGYERGNWFVIIKKL